MARPRTITDLGEALVLAPRLDRAAREQAREFLAESLPPGLCHDWLERHFVDRETALVVLEDAPGEPPAGFCLTGPFVDPLWPERIPMVLLLYVEPARRHQGLARELVGAAARELAARGLTRLAARAGTNDDALISMGERWGFVRQWELMLRE